MTAKILDKIGDWNPQLLRELQGRLTPKNLLISGVFSAIGQILLYLYFNSQANTTASRHRYCTGSFGAGYYRSNPSCQSIGGQVQINSALWSLDFFITLSIICVFVLLVVGIYFLIDDLGKEEKQGTLNFIRLSPQSDRSILWGKLLGVPILIYLGVLLTLPLNLGLGLAAQIPLSLILAFYGIVLLTCLFFYSAALLFALTTMDLGGLQAWLGSGTILGLLWYTTAMVLNGYNPNLFNSFDWLLVLNPTRFLTYLVATTGHSLDIIDYLNIKDLGQVAWYHNPLWIDPTSAFSFYLLNYSLGIYLIWHGLGRRFQNRSIAIFNKQHSYWLSGALVFILLGFVPQHHHYDFYEKNLLQNFQAIFALQFIFFIALIFALSPHRKTLQNWSRYRHQKTKKNLLWDLMWGEESPATLAIALNLIPASAVILAAISLLPLGQYRWLALTMLLLTDGIILLYGSLVQWLLLQKTKHRTIAAILATMSLVFFPLIAMVVVQWETSLIFWASISIIPVVDFSIRQMSFNLFSIVGLMISQTLAIALINLQMIRQLRSLGQSDLQTLLQENSPSRKLSGVS